MSDTCDRCGRDINQRFGREFDLCERCFELLESSATRGGRSRGGSLGATGDK